MASKPYTRSAAATMQWVVNLLRVSSTPVTLQRYRCLAPGAPDTATAASNRLMARARGEGGSSTPPAAAPGKHQKVTVDSLKPSTKSKKSKAACHVLVFATFPILPECCVHSPYMDASMHATPVMRQCIHGIHTVCYFDPKPEVLKPPLTVLPMCTLCHCIRPLLVAFNLAVII